MFDSVSKFYSCAMEDVILIIVIASLIVFVKFQQGRMFYLRSWKSFKTDISDYLESKNLEFVDSKHPDNIDWKKSPFQKPKGIQVKLAVIKINGVPVKWTDKQYKVVRYKNKGKEKTMWVEIETTYFKKTKFNFKL